MSVDYSLEIKFDKANMTYRPNDTITGNVKVVFSESSSKKIDITQFSYRGEGVICAQNKDTNKELEKISVTLQPLLLFMSEGRLTKDTFVTSEKNIFPFSIPLVPFTERRIIETYVGVYIAVAYEIQIEMRLLNGTFLRFVQPFFVVSPGQGRERIKEDQNKYPRPEQFKITPEKLFQNTAAKTNTKFKLSGIIDTTICNYVDDFHGSLIIEECESDIRTIDLQLIRVEKIDNKSGKISEATEIQLIQIVEGNATRGIDIPFNMIFPKYFSCPNFAFRDYSVDFEVNLIMILFDGFKVTLNFPLNIVRL